jgi:hypothetical protein
VLYNNNHTRRCTVNKSLRDCVCVCVHACVHMHTCMYLCSWKMLMVYTSTHLLQSRFSTRLTYVRFRIKFLNRILLTDVMPHRPNQSTNKLLPNHLCINPQYDSSKSNTILLSFTVTNTS